MKKFIFMLFTALMFALGLTSCGNSHTPRLWDSGINKRDSVILVRMIENITQNASPLDAKYSDVTDLILDKHIRMDRLKQDSIFLHMDDQLISNIFQTVSNREHRPCTVREIIDEYLTYRNVYDNLPGIDERAAYRPEHLEQYMIEDTIDVSKEVRQ